MSFYEMNVPNYTIKSKIDENGIRRVEVLITGKIKEGEPNGNLTIKQDYMGQSLGEEPYNYVQIVLGTSYRDVTGRIHTSSTKFYDTLDGQFFVDYCLQFDYEALDDIIYGSHLQGTEFGEAALVLS